MGQTEHHHVRRLAELQMREHIKPAPTEGMIDSYAEYLLGIRENDMQRMSQGKLRLLYELGKASGD